MIGYYNYSKKARCEGCGKYDILTRYDQLCGYSKHCYNYCKSCYYKTFGTECVFVIMIIILGAWIFRDFVIAIEQNSTRHLSL